MHDAASLAPHLQKYQGRRAKALRLTGIMSLGLGLALGAGTDGGCGGSSDSMLLVKVSNIPATTVKLSVKASLDGKAALQGMDITMNLTPPTGSFGVAVPASTSGGLTLDVDALDNTGCVLGSAETPSITLPSQKVDEPLMVALVAADTSKCTIMPPPTCATGLLCPYTPLPQKQGISNLWAISDKDIWGVGASGLLVHYDGTNWTKVTPPSTMYDFNAVWASGPSDVWVVGSAGSIYHYNGSSWSPSSNLAAAALNGIYGLSPTNIWAVGNNYLGSPEFWRWNGSSWTFIDVGFSGNLRGVWASSSTDIHACGDNGFLLRYNGNWGKITGTTADLKAIWGTSANQVFAVGSGGTILYYGGSGPGWVKVSSTGTNSNLNALFGDGTNLFAVGNGGTFVRGTAPFTSFTSVSTGIQTDLYAVQPTGSGSGIGWVAGAGGYLADYKISR